MTRITVACLDMAGTTVADDGTRAWTRSPRPSRRRTCPWPALQPGHDGRAVEHGPVQDRGVPADPRRRGRRAAGQRRRSRSHYAAAVRAGRSPPLPGADGDVHGLRDAGIRVCLATGFSPRPGTPSSTELGWGELIDLALSPADAGRGRPWPDMPLTALLRLGGGAVSELAVAGDTASDVESGLRAGAGIVAGVLTGASSRDGPGAGRRPAHPGHDRGHPPLRRRVSRSGAGRPAPARGGNVTDDRRARGQRGRLGARLVHLDRHVAGQQDADPGHRAEEGPGGHDPVAVLHDLHRQPFRPDQHVHRPSSPGPGLGCAASSTGTVAPSTATVPSPVSSAGNPVHDADELGHERGGRVGRTARRARRSAPACPAA